MATGSPTDPNLPDGMQYDPVFLNSRREALIILCVWLVAMLWAVPYCYFNGYGTPVDPENFKMVWGVPSWIMWGIAAPWLVADLFTVWFCFFYMADDDLGEVDEEADNAEMQGSSREQKVSEA